MVADSLQDTPDFRLQFNIFHELMSFKVREILLVSSPYDAFIMEEDSSIATRIIKEYQELNLSGAPRITRVSTKDEAIRVVSENSIDIVFTMPYLQGVDGVDLGVALKKIKPDLPVILIGSNLRAMSFVPELGLDKRIDNVFLWCCEVDLLVAIIKSVEDRVNVDVDTRRAMVRVILYVEDSPIHRSLFLPIIYHELVRQTQAVLDESLSEKHRLLRMRARPKILTAGSYEEALDLYEKYKPYIFSVISDARLPKRGEVNGNAGQSFLRKVRQELPDLPMLMVSSEGVNREVAANIPAVFIDKNSPMIKDDFHRFFLDHLGFGEFIFRLPDGTAVCTAANMHEFEDRLHTIPDESFLFHLKHNHFSNWVMARAEVALAKRLHHDVFAESEDINTIREDVIHKVNDLRRLRQRSVIVRYTRDSYDPLIMDFVKIGEGSIGGKARGIAFMWTQLSRVADSDSVLKKVSVGIPKTCVVTAEGFVDFVRINNLHFQESMTDDMVAELFLAAKLPDWLQQDLIHFLEQFTWPLSVRSSSLLEDAQYKPYAGLYSTFFLANNHPDFQVRLSHLEEAVKRVYSSTWFEGPRAFSKSSNQGLDDSMAIILQQVVGENFNGYLYPAVSGVAQSHNYYPVMHMKKNDGIAHIAIGLGTTVVEGEKSLRFSPAFPQNLVQFSSVDEILSNTQRFFYALDMSHSDTFHSEMSNLVKREVQECEDEMPVKALSSTYVADEHRIRDFQMQGMKVMTFARILKYEMYPLAQILSEILELSRQGMGCDVEIEFAVKMDQMGKLISFYFLQMRPMVIGSELMDVQIADDERSSAICYSSQSLGHGLFDTMMDIIFIKPDVFDPAYTKIMATEIGDINHELEKEQRNYLLIGPGRWGSADRWLGIPVQWHDIFLAGAIIEVSHELLKADPSQGTHFFQNITSLGIPYLTVDNVEFRPEEKRQSKKQSFLDYHWLMNQQVKTDHTYVRHIRLDKPFILKCNGKKSEAVLHGE